MTAWPTVPQPGSGPLAVVPPIEARTVSLTPASRIKVRPVRWLWQDRVPLGSLALLAGREGIGKSTVGYTMAADITRGQLAGQYLGQPKSVIVAATEDSWEHTIVPRLMAADADLERIYRVDVTTFEGIATGLSLPRDLTAVERSVLKVDAALILLDPLMSRLDGKLDTHKDAEVRQALEPLTALADRTSAAVVGLIHVNKSSSGDPLTLIMGSRAFAAVARSVMYVMTDPDDESIRLLGTPKNNLGRTDLPTLVFRIDSAHVADTDEGPVWTGKVVWIGESERTIREALESAAEGTETRSAAAEAGDWLADYLNSQGGSADYAELKAAGQKAGHSIDSLKRSRNKLGIGSQSYGFPRKSRWHLPEPQSVQSSECSSGESALTALTALTAAEPPQSVQCVQSEQSPDGWHSQEPDTPDAGHEATTAPCEICGRPGDHLDAEAHPYCERCREGAEQLHLNGRTTTS